VWWGAIIAFVGSIGGEWLGFELARRYGTRLSARFIGDEAERRRLDAVLVTHGAAAVAATRALPVVMETMSIVAGLSPMPRRTFLIASAIGTAPIVLVYAYAGAMSKETGSLVPAIVILLAVAAAGWIWYRAARR
ncbi:MAG TPA: VTT domain-containing protein, partial [Vicinamibacterales bacterium]